MTAHTLCRLVYSAVDSDRRFTNRSATARAARKIRSRHRLILTGTPVQNRINELWATFDFLMPNFLGSKTAFAKEFARPIGKSQQLSVSADTISEGMEKLKTLHQQVLPFILRREKGHVLKDLPPKTITDIPCSMTDYQKKLYTRLCETPIVQKSLVSFNELLDASQDDTLSAENTEPISGSIGSNVLRSLLHLRWLCTHPALVEGHCDIPSTRASVTATSRLVQSGKLAMLNELLRTAQICPAEVVGADDDSSALYVPSVTAEEPVESETAVLDGNDGHDETVGSPDDGGLLSSAPSLSKPDPVKCLIFAQFRQSLDIVERYLFECHMPSLRYLRLDGGVPAERRSALVDEFNDDPSIRVMLLTTRVGGLGLNLTGASVVVFLESDYNPHSDLQAMDRAHRIGQTKRVNVYRLVTTDTIEEKIMSLQQNKLRMSDAIVTSDNSSLFSMGTDRLLDIFTVRSSQTKSDRGEGAAGNGTERASKGGYGSEGNHDEDFASEYAHLEPDSFVRQLGEETTK